MALPHHYDVIVYRDAKGAESFTDWLNSQRRDIRQAQSYWKAYQSHE